MSRISLILLCLLLSGCEAEYPPVGTLWNDFKARVDIKLEKYEEAALRYYDVIAAWPTGIEAHSNVGVILSQLQKNEEALKSFDQALLLADQQKDLKAMFYVLYNKGVYYGKLKNVEQALNNYQAALEIVPTSIEVKTNIELLIQQQQKDQKNQKDQKDKQDQDKKDGQGQSDQKSDPKDGKGQDPKDDKKDQKNQDKKDPKDQKDKNDQQKDQDKKDQQDQDKKNQEHESSMKYKPRPYQGDQLSEGDVKKILGELRNQEQKIRANFDKKEKGKSGRNEKDW